MPDESAEHGDAQDRLEVERGVGQRQGLHLVEYGVHADLQVRAAGGDCVE